MKICNFLAFTGGMLAGGLVMMMFAPKKGEEVRVRVALSAGALSSDDNKLIALLN